ncbi:hypothetical protein B0H13DRAFT_2313603 [Mycena leptocephala]|nr:hypothetical protein B0H13DRAFT_2313603 [Mycena leptocephala]
MRSVKSKFRHKFLEDTEAKKHIKTVCAGLSTVLGLVKDVASNAGIPGLAMSVRGLKSVLDVIEKTAQNVDDVEGLSKHLESLTSVLENAKKRGRLSPVDSQWLTGQIQAVSWSIESFTVDTMLDVEFTLDEQFHRVHENGQIAVGKLDQIHEKVDDVLGELQTRDGYPPHAKKALFNSKHREPCLASTRTEILAEITRWINTDDSIFTEVAIPENTPIPRIFWLNGSAGTGKTTIAYTVAQDCSARSPCILGASFFCSRDDANCSSLLLIFTTIAYQLSLFDPLFAAEVSKVLQAKPDIGYASAYYQLEELIVKPLRVVRDTFAQCVVILDALDECKDPATISTILSALSRYIEELAPIRFLVTSRPENHINVAFTSERLQPNTRKFILHQVKLRVVEQDIRHYLSMKLAETRRIYQIQELWPTAESLDLLARLSSGLFIFAATSIKYIEDRSYSNPRSRLQHLVGSVDTTVEEFSPFKRLDDLYTDVLVSAFPKISASFLGVLKMVLGSIVHLQDPLSIVALEQLLGLAPGRVRETLLHLHAVVIVPDDHNHVIQLLHPSFADFITNQERCSIPKYVVKLEEQHTLLAHSCLVAMKSLSRDVCQIKNPSLLNSEVTDLPTRIGKYIPADIQYACRHWAYHVSKGMVSSTLLNLLKNFCEQHLFHWIEVSSLLGELQSALLSLDDVLRTLSVTLILHSL